MINWTKTRHLYSDDRLLLNASYSTIQEGMAVVPAAEGGLMKVQPATGATSGLAGKLEGIAMSPRRTGSKTKGAVTITTPSGGGVVLLPNTVLSNSNVGVFVASNGTQLTASTSSASSSNVQVSTDSTTGLTALTFDSTVYGLGGGVVLNVFYDFVMAPSVENALYGNTSPGFFASDMLGKIGVIKIGRVSVSNYDPQANWYAGASSSVKVIANGIFTDINSSSAGFTATGVNILAFPTPSNPWLELEINLA